MQPLHLLSRRCMLTGMAMAGATWQTVAWSQAATPSDEFRVLRVQSGGALPGPLLRAKQGEGVKVRLLNDLGEPTSVHWHGVRLRNAMDGTALTQTPVRPGQSFDYRFSVPDAGTFWYHPPAARGFYGMLVVDEALPVAVDRESVLIFDDAGAARVNGADGLDVPVRANERLRLRLLNAAQSRVFSIRFDRHRPMVMAIDGQPAEPFAARDGRLVLGPGNRIDVFMDCTLLPGATAPVLVESAAEAVAVAHVSYGPDSARSAPLPPPLPLPKNPLPERMDFRNALRRDLPIEAAIPNTLPERPLLSVKRGRTVMLNCDNRTEDAQVFHLHGHSFRLLDRLDDGWKPFWLDTMPLEPRSNARIAFVADNPGKWMLEAHAQTLSLAAWFEVT